ncbi:hypothetical protein J7T55_010015 [Diaporthe amygdali]|uniref:uncharacterized protein n=1 Tax=Phomopsis amygdali TaxID=1214568 RepID=UPI0022FF0E2C|nr:uncharacterized protein J7T55_010015 [Diaporthe amygdali]KAJ0116864.1 hypothetical protein J7T55_010015 [Diaporthe amygdali]
MLATLFLAACALQTRAIGLAQASQDEAPMIRSYIQAGGQYAENSAGEHIFQDQIYVEHLVPVHGVTQRHPIVFLHGAAQTATNWLNKPDGGRGWASRFIEQGYELYLVDQPSRGRSTWQPATGPELDPPFAAENLQQRFTASEKYNLWPQAALHTQWNGTGLMGDPIFDRFYSSQVQYTSNLTFQQHKTQAAGAALLDGIGKPVILVGHSAGGQLPIVIADARPGLTAGLILLEPSGPPFENAGVQGNGSARAWGVADIPLTYDPPVTDPAVDLVKQTVAALDEDHVNCTLQADSPAPRKLVNLAGKPFLVVTSESSFHAQYDYCIVDYLRQAGCSSLEYVELGAAGIHGNGHMMFLEKNSDDIQNLLQEWIAMLN